MTQRANPQSAHAIGARVALYHFAIVAGVSMLFQTRGCIYNPLGDLWRRVDAPALWLLHQFNPAIPVDRGAIIDGFGYSQLVPALLAFFGTILVSSVVYGLLTVTTVWLWRTTHARQSFQ